MTTRTRDLTQAAALLLAAALALLTLTPTAQGGGFSVTTLDPLPTTPRAGDTLPVGYTVRLHGVTPIGVSGGGIAITGADGERRFFPGRHQGPEGHHVADVRMPPAGDWEWAYAFGATARDAAQPLGTLTVAPPVDPQPPAAPASAATGGPGAMAWSLLGATIAALALLGARLWRRRHPAPAAPARAA